MKSTRLYLVLAMSAAAALGLSACSNSDNAPSDTSAPPAAMSTAKPAMPPVTEAPAMAPASTVMPAQPATTSSVH